MFLTIIASILIASVSIYQFKKEAKEYHQDRLERKENAIVEHINYDRQTVVQNMKLHDPKSPLLIGHLEKGDVVKETKQKSYFDGQTEFLFWVLLFNMPFIFKII